MLNILMKPEEKKILQIINKMKNDDTFQVVFEYDFIRTDSVLGKYNKKCLEYVYLTTDIRFEVVLFDTSFSRDKVVKRQGLSYMLRTNEFKIVRNQMSLAFRINLWFLKKKLLYPLINEQNKQIVRQKQEQAENKLKNELKDLTSLIMRL